MAGHLLLWPKTPPAPLAGFSVGLEAAFGRMLLIGFGATEAYQAIVRAADRALREIPL